MAEANPVQSDAEPNLKQDSSEEDLEETSQLECSCCGHPLPQTDFYRCKECVEESDQISTFQIFCENCILMHIRKGHDVTDCKGYSPKVCRTHKNLCLMHCDDCQTVFCFNCLGPHCQHRFLPVSEKAREVRKEVFEYLNKFEQLSKSLAFRETDVRDVTKLNDELYGGLSNNNLTDFLCDKFVSVLRNNHSSWTNVAEFDRKMLKTASTVVDVFSVSTTASSRVADLRNILTLSDGFCVSTFLESKSTFDSSIDEQNSELDIHTARSWCNNLDNLMKFSIESSLKHWQIPEIYRQKVPNIEVINAMQNRMTNNSDQRLTRNNVTPCFFYLPSPPQDDSTNKQTNSKISECRDCCANKIRPGSSPMDCNDIFDMKRTPTTVSFCSLVFTKRQKLLNGGNTMCWSIEKYLVSNEITSVLRHQNEVALMGAHSRQMNIQSLESCKAQEQTLTQSRRALAQYPYNVYQEDPHFANVSSRNQPQPRGYFQSNAANQTVNLPSPNIEPVAFLGRVITSTAQPHLILFWNSKTKSLQQSVRFSKQFPCESKPSSIHYLKYADSDLKYINHKYESYFLAYVQLRHKVSLVDSNTGLTIEVGRPEHGLNQIDNLRFDKVQDKRKGCIVLFDYKQRLAVTCEFNLESVLLLNFSIRSVCKFKVPASEKVQLMTILSDHVVIVTDNFVYREERYS